MPAAADRDRPATRTFIPVTEESYRLHSELSHGGLNARDLRARTSALAHHLRLAGTTTREEERRSELEIHLGYWAGIRRIATGSWDRALRPEKFDPANIRDFAGDMLAEAQSPVGLGHYQVQGVSVNGSGRHVDRFLAEGCRLVGGSLRNLETGEMNLVESGLFGITLTGIKVAGALNAKFAAGLSSMLDLEVGSIDMTRSVFRNSTFSVRAVGPAVFDAADLQREQTGTIDEFLLLVKLPTWRKEESPVAFVGCEFQSVSFAGALLQGCRFERCELGNPTFEGAYIDGCRFTNCTVHGDPMTTQHLRGATGIASLVP